MSSEKKVVEQPEVNVVNAIGFQRRLYRLFVELVSQVRLYKFV